jgi:hypothetical protein
VIENGGEGVIAREPESAYVSGMHDSFVKFKVSLTSSLLSSIRFSQFFVRRSVTKKV